MIALTPADVMCATPLQGLERGESRLTDFGRTGAIVYIVREVNIRNY